MTRIWIAMLLLGAATRIAGAQEDVKMKINVIVGGETLIATLDATAAARDFASMLPLELELTDYHGIEKVADLGRELASTGHPVRYTPKSGDITQYAPWKNLAIFTSAFSSSMGLVRLGQFDGEIAILAAPGPIKVRIEQRN